MPITQTVLQTAHDHPHRVAIAGEDGRLTYSELVADSRSMFAAVASLHAEQQDPPAPAAETQGIPVTAVSVESAFHIARIVTGLAGFRAVSATIDPRWPLAHRVGVVQSTGIGLVISDSEDLADALAHRGWTGTVISLADFTALESRMQETMTAAVPAPTVREGTEPFLMLFSSGTTSDPKAFLKTRDQYRANVAVSSAYLEPLPGVVTLAPGPVSYSLTLYAVIECMATGGSVHVADAFDALAAGRRIAAEKVSRVVAVPAVAQALTTAARRDPERFAALELVVTGGANLPESIRAGLAQALPDVRLISYYGAAEIGFIGDSRAGDGTLISVYDGIEASVRDEFGASLPHGEIGTLWVRAGACSDGYLAGTTAEVLRGANGWATVHDQARLVPVDDDPAAEAAPGDEVSSAGAGPGVMSADAVSAAVRSSAGMGPGSVSSDCVCPAGARPRLQLVGRKGDIAVTGGHKVALPEVERAFDDFPGLGEVCAVALEDHVLGTVVALVVEPAAPGGELPTKAQLQERAQAELAPQFIPRRWFALDELPRTVGRKIKRPATQELVHAGKATRL